MRVCLKLTSALCLFAFAASAAFAQSAASIVPEEKLSNGNMAHTLAAATVRNAPFSATLMHESVKTLPDGSHVTSHGHHNVARDSEGRFRVEMRTGTKSDPITLVFVTDPVAHTLTNWAEGGKSQPVAMVRKFYDPSSARSTVTIPAPATNRPKPEKTRQDIGNTLFNGLSVQDVKITTVFPVGYSGNDAPITETEELWTSPELQLIVKQQWTDPRTGVRTQSLEHLSRTEPDAALFHAPAGYQVKDSVETMRELAAKLNAAADAQQ